MKAFMDRETTVSNAHNYSGEKETIRTLCAVVSSKGKLQEVVTLRIYSGRARYAQTILASVWVMGRTSTGYISKGGTGKADGYGYCKSSAAAAEAFESAGITFDESIDGRGMSVVHQAIEATVRAMGFRGQLIVVEN